MVQLNVKLLAAPGMLAFPPAAAAYLMQGEGVAGDLY
jgi:hypothetical protein